MGNKARETDEVIGKVRKWVFLYVRLVKYTINRLWIKCMWSCHTEGLNFAATVIFCLCSFVILSSAHWMPADILVSKEEFSLENCDILMSQYGDVYHQRSSHLYTAINNCSSRIFFIWFGIVSPFSLWLSKTKSFGHSISLSYSCLSLSRGALMYEYL